MSDQNIDSIKQVGDLPAKGYSLNLKDGKYKCHESLFGKIAVWALPKDPLASDKSPLNVWIVMVNGFKVSAEYGNFSKLLRNANISVANRVSAPSNLIEAIYESRNIADDEESRRNKDEDNEFITYFNDLVKRALALDASDIHIEKRDNIARIRFRVNGELVTVDELSPNRATRLNSVIYGTLSEVGTAGIQPDPKKYQSSSVAITVGGQKIKLRYQSLVAYAFSGGQDVVMRVLKIDSDQTTNKTIDLELLGYSADHVKTLINIIKRPVGALIVSGTTGSGKSTTLQQLIMYVNQLRNFKIKIYSIEDPPEYFIPGITQLPVLTDNSGESDVNPFYVPLKATMRADPDLIMIGEIRDAFTADGLKKETQSGHQIMSTVHTGSALGIPERLEDFKISLSVMGSNEFLSGMVYQKLVPQLCDKCSRSLKDEFNSSTADDSIIGMAQRLTAIGVDFDTDNIRLRNEAGCEHCRLGISKRTVCAEVIEPDYTLYKCFREGKKIEAYIYWRSLSDGDLRSDKSRGKTAMEHAIYKMIKGIVSPSDVEFLFGPVDSYNRFLEELKKDQEKQANKSLLGMDFLNGVATD